MDTSREWSIKQAQLMAVIGLLTALEEKFATWKVPAGLTAENVRDTVVASLTLLEGQMSLMLMEDADLDFQQIADLVKKLKS